MQTNKEFKSFTAAAKEFFGLQPNQDLRGFLQETQSLSPDDKAEIAKGMEAHGIKIV